MTDFSQAVHEWQTFYQVAGTAAATLIGLLFVAVSIHIEIFTRKAITDIHHFAALTFNCFFYVLLIAMFFLIPRLSPLGLGIPLALLGLLGLVNAVIQQARSRKWQSVHQGMDLASRFNLPNLCLACLIVIAVCVMLGLTQSLYALVVVVILLLASAAQNAWTLLVQTDEAKPKRK
jgi:hypothetical protein